MVLSQLGGVGGGGVGRRRHVGNRARQLGEFVRRVLRRLLRGFYLGAEGSDGGFAGVAAIRAILGGHNSLLQVAHALRRV